MQKTNNPGSHAASKAGHSAGKSTTGHSSTGHSSSGNASSDHTPSGPRSTSGKAGSRSSNSPTKQGSSRARRNPPVEDSRLKEFFVDELKDILWAEQKLVKTLPELQEAASSEELQQAFKSHLQETKTHVERLEQAFKILGEKASAKKCDAMEGITEEGKSVIEDTEDGTATRDVALVLAGQKAEHYEIATYGGLIQLAHTLGQEEVAELLEQTLEEEKAADEKLTSIAENGINYEASAEEGEEGEEE